MALYRQGGDASQSRAREWRRHRPAEGPLTVTEERLFLSAVDAGSEEISVFLVDVTPGGGGESVAVAQHGDLVYVVDTGVTSNVVGFPLGAGQNGCAWTNRVTDLGLQI